MKTFDEAVSTILTSQRLKGSLAEPGEILLAASILVLADTLHTALSGLGDDVMRASSDIAGSIENK